MVAPIPTTGRSITVVAVAGTMGLDTAVVVATVAVEAVATVVDAETTAVAADTVEDLTITPTPITVVATKK